MQLDVDLARTAMQRLADTLGMSVEEAALGALQIQKFGMAQAIEVNSVRRGYDPREFTLVAAGGAGPLFACDIALELEIPRVLVPPHPGIIAATGLLATDLQHEFVATERHALKSLDIDRLRARYDELQAQAVAQLDADGVEQDRRLLRRLADCRYAGQGYEVRFDVPAREIDDGWVDELKQAFHRAHEAEYGHRFDAEIEIVNIRVVGIGRIAELEPSTAETGGGDPSEAKTLEREVVFDVDGQARAPDDAVLRTRATPRGRPGRGARDHRAVRLDDGRSARPLGRDRPVRQHRRRLLAARQRRWPSARTSSRRRS